MKFVVVSQRVDVLSDRDEIRDAVDQRLVTFLLETGYFPVPIPNSLCMEKNGDRFGQEKLDAWLTSIKPVAIVLSGGNDIGQSAARDFTENWLLDRASETILPVLAICRGMQMMAHWANVELRPVAGHVKRRHRLSGQITDTVNSYHDYALENCPQNFDVLASSEDGVIEAIRHQSLPWEGWMWHPEREADFNQNDILRVKRLFL